MRSYTTQDGVIVLSNRPTEQLLQNETRRKPTRITREELRHPPSVPSLPQRHPQRAARKRAKPDDALTWQLGLLGFVAIGLALTGLWLWRTNERS